MLAEVRKMSVVPQSSTMYSTVPPGGPIAPAPVKSLFNAVGI